MKTTSGRDVDQRVAATHRLREAMTATREAREILVLFARIGMDDTSRLEVYATRLKKSEQAERRIRNALLRQSQAPVGGR